MSDKKPFVPVVAVLNMKGGVGKTTISANVFRVLFERKRVGTLLIDLDPQFNLSQALHTREAYDALKDAGKTVAAAMEPTPDVGLFEIKTSDQPPPSPASLSHTFYHFKGAKPEKNLDLVAGDFSMVKYSLMDDSAKLKKVRNRFSKFIDGAKNDYQVICLDCNPSSSFLTMCALEVCTHILVPVRPDRYSILGLEVLWKFVHEIIPITPKPEFIVLLNGLPRSVGGTNVGIVEAELRGHNLFGVKTLANSLRHSGVLEAKADYTGFATDKKVPWSAALMKEVSAVADELAGKLGVK
ncbi:MAG: ParA family protein [Alphaproteobacteria bacterium]|nr:MAG: ParA family protein [Alphaproteobacteria bacterium]